ncbi:hypothetical protein [uncultured Polaribacter sp.]|uniref:hypothetical protein n=1 Tax=uncultured Polaribacter sp. TaxID=174711 RepID=UPI00261421CC|nr:hypothetical protein [uncultured Polaribacter sp.]
MKRFSTIISIVLIISVIYWSFSDAKPSITEKVEVAETDFSIDNALFYLKNILEKAHFVGSKEHKTVQNYIVKQLEKLGL